MPALGATRTKAQAIGCLNNTRQLTLAWHLYSTDYNDRVANNYGVDQTIGAISSKRLDNWINNVMTWGAGANVEDSSNTNQALVVDGVLGRYTAGAVGVYKCPADNALSQAQLRAGFTRRNRSLSMNALFGSAGEAVDNQSSGYRQYLSQGQVPRPAKTWLFVDEHPDTINDGHFIEILTLNHWQDIPASYHNDGCGFAFADGHSELRKWRSRTSRYPGVMFTYERPRMDFDAVGRADYAWYLERTGYVDSGSGAPLFNY